MWKRATSKRHYYKHRERLLKVAKAYRARSKRVVRECQLKYFYGITLKDFERMARRQKFRCGICRKGRI